MDVTSDSDPDAPSVVLKRTCPSCGVKFRAERDFCPRCKTSYRLTRGLGEWTPGRGLTYDPMQAALNWSLWGGVSIILLGVGLFLVGLLAGWIVYYAPAIALVGVYGVIRGLSRRRRAASESRSRARREKRGATRLR